MNFIFDAYGPSPPVSHLERGLSRYHKYTLGHDLRRAAQRLCRLIVRANQAHAEVRYAALDELVLAVEGMSKSTVKT